MSTIAGGSHNYIYARDATIGGGNANSATGDGTTVPGGSNNSAEENYTFAAGRQAKAQHSGAVVFGDSSFDAVYSQNDDEARFQMDVATQGDLETWGGVSADGDLSTDGELSFSDGTPQRTAGPLAKGRSDADGSIRSAVNVDSATWNSSYDRYEITITNVHYSIYHKAASVTPIGDPIAVSTSSVSGDLLVEFEDARQCAFHFVVYDI